MASSRVFTAAVHQEDDWYVARCLEVDVASQGRTVDEAVANVADAVKLYLDAVDKPAQHVGPTPLFTAFKVEGVA